MPYITEKQFEVLRLIKKSPTPLSCGDLGRELGISGQCAYSRIKQLIKKNMVSLSGTFSLKLTPSGKRILETGSSK